MTVRTREMREKMTNCIFAALFIFVLSFAFAAFIVPVAIDKEMARQETVRKINVERGYHD